MGGRGRSGGGGGGGGGAGVAEKGVCGGVEGVERVGVGIGGGVGILVALTRASWRSFLALFLSTKHATFI